MKDSTKYVLIMLSVSFFSGAANMRLWDMVGLPDTGPGKKIWCLMLPLSLAGFSILTAFLSEHHKHRRKPLLRESWFSLGVIPWIALIISARSWGPWPIVMGLFYFIFGILHVYFTSLSLAELPSRRDRIKGTAGLYLLIILSLVPFFRSLPSGIHLHSVLVGGIATAIIAFIVYCCLNVNDGEPASIYIRMFRIHVGAMVPVFLPFQNAVTDPPIIYPAAILLPIVYYMMSAPQRHLVLLNGTLLLLICLPLFTNTELIGLSLWALACLAVLAQWVESSRRSILKSGGVVLFILILSLLILRHEGHFFSGDYIWGFNGPGILFGGFLDIHGGFLFGAPLTGLAILGACFLLFKQHDKRHLVLYSGLIAAYLPITYFSYTNHGIAPDLTRLLPAIALLIPLISGYENVIEHPFGNALYRMATAMTLMIGATGFIMHIMFPGSPATWGRLLQQLEENSDLSYMHFFPVMNQLSPFFTKSLLVWLGICFICAALIFMEHLVVRKKSLFISRETAFFILLSLMMLGMFVGTDKIRSWETVHMENDLDLTDEHPEVSIPFRPDHPVYGVRMVSHLSNATGLEQGFPIGCITLIGKGRKRSVLPIRVGIETAEWAYDRPDVLPVIRHNRPETIFNRIEELQTGQTFERHSYLSRWFLEKPRVPIRIELEKFPVPNAPNVILTIEHLQVRIRKPSSGWGYPQPISLKQPIILNSERKEITLPVQLDRAASRLILHSNLANAAGLTDGIIVAEIHIRDIENRTQTILLRSGLDTAEWAHDRKDLKNNVQHSLPRIAISKKEKDSDGCDFLSHIYRAEKVMDASIVPVQMKIKLRIPEDTAPAGALTIYSITFL